MGMRIFVCEDSAGYRLVIKSVLDAEPEFEVVGEACDGQQCIDEVAQADPDVVLLDINMPRMNGLDALPELLEAVPEAKIVMLSTGSAEEYEQRSLARGAHGYIEKPASAPDLVDALMLTLDDAA
jgi:DNA-binding NarL/FixJ family response regulator